MSRGILFLFDFCAYLSITLSFAINYELYGKKYFISGLLLY